MGSEMQNAIFGQLARGAQTLDSCLSGGAAEQYAVLPTAKAAPDLAELCRSFWQRRKPAYLGDIGKTTAEVFAHITRPELDAFDLGHTGWQRLVMPLAPFDGEGPTVV